MLLRRKWYLMQATDGEGGDVGGGAAGETGDAGAGAGETAVEPAAPESTREALEQAFAKHEQQQQDPAAQARVRDEHGRFAKRQQDAALKAASDDAAARLRGEQQGAPKQGGEPVQREAPQRTAYVPQSWKPEARAHWDKLPPEVQSEVARREGEIQRALQESAQTRSVVQSLQGVLGPYNANIQAMGGDAVGMMKNLFQADHELRHGNTAHKAQVVANIIKTYGVDIAALDGVLAGQPVQEDPRDAMLAALRKEIQQQLQPVQGFMQTIAQRREEQAQQMRAKADEEVAALAAQPHFEEVREDMADILEGAARRGVAMTLEQAYNRALRVHPTLGESFAARAFEQQRNEGISAAQRARRAAVSPSGGAPAGHGAPAAGAADTVRGALEAAFDAHAGE